MTTPIFLRFVFSALLIGFSATPVWALDQGRPAKSKFNLPPSAELSYSIKAQQSELPLDGDALVKWATDNKKFTVATETRAMLVGKILDAKSEGVIDEYGLAPTTFTEKRFRKDLTTVSFDRDAKTISFTGSNQTYPIKGGEQDRSSAIWQLIAIARGAPAKFKTASNWTFFVAGQHDAEPWTFKVVRQEKIDSPLGKLTALHMVKAPPPNAKGQQLDIWLAPSLEWYPVRLRFTETDGDFIEQTLEKIGK